MEEVGERRNFFLSYLLRCSLCKHFITRNSPILFYFSLLSFIYPMFGQHCSFNSVHEFTCHLENSAVGACLTVSIQHLPVITYLWGDEFLP